MAEFLPNYPINCLKLIGVGEKNKGGEDLIFSRFVYWFQGFNWVIRQETSGALIYKGCSLPNSLPSKWGIGFGELTDLFGVAGLRVWGMIWG